MGSSIDVGLVLSGLVVGVIVGLTGMGGGALMTPMLVFFFGLNPLAAVSSDLVTSAIMKPFGGAVHAHRGTVNRALVGWLALGSVPSAFLGVFVLRGLGGAATVDDVVTKALGVALVVAALALIGKAYVSMSRGARDRGGGGPNADGDQPPLRIAIRPLPTVLIGMVGGLVVGMTSVGSGSLIIIALMFLYPRLPASQLVGTDLIQAVPLVAAAALGHLLFGDFRLGVTASRLDRGEGGRWPGLLAWSPNIPTTVTAVVLVACLILGPLVWMAARRRHGLTALRHQHSVLNRVDH